MSGAWRHSVCRSCHGGCGALVHIENGRVTRVKGDPKSPVSRGFLCIKGVKSPYVANHKDRLTVPLKRIGERGAGKWQEVSWDIALNEIAERLAKIKSETGPETIAIGQGTGRHHYLHVVRFANAFGTPNWYEPGLAQCFIPRITVSNLTYGGFVHADYYSDTNPRLILFWGHNPLVSSADGELAPAVKRAMTADGVVNIAIDPIRSETAKKCDLWIAVRPGTDAALAMAMAHVIIEEKLYDKEFVENRTTGFAELAERVKPCTPAWASKITDVPAEKIEKIARLYATFTPGVIEWGVGIEQNSNSLQTVRAIAILRGLTGNIDRPGSDILGMNRLRAYPVLKDKLPKSAAKKRIGGEDFKLLSGWRAYFPSAHIPGLFKAMRESDPYRVRGLMLFGNNPLTTVANSKGVYQALKKLDLLVTTDLFMTPSAYLSDYVLPASFWTEIDHLMGFPLVAENFAFAHPKLTQTGQCRQDEWIIDELSKKLDLPGSDMSYKDIFDHQLTDTGFTFNKLIKNGLYHTPPVIHEKFMAKGFRTPSRKVELYCKALKRMAYDPLPHFTEPTESRVSQPETARDFPYTLITGARVKPFFHSDNRQVEALRKLRPDPIATIPTAIAKERGIVSDDWVIIGSPRGEIRMKACVTDDIAPDVINVDHGWWFPERGGDPLFGVFESNANMLTDDSPPYDPAFGSYKLKGLLCNVRKAG